jgi:hypothetical protein
MRTRIVFLGVVVAAMTLGAAIPQYGQNAAPLASDAENARHMLAVDILRSINTAEVLYQSVHGSYATWDDLLASKEFAEYAKECLANIPELAAAHFAKSPEILPGWTLRLNLTQGGKGYDLLLEDATDKKCGYAAATDERGVIRQSKWIDCPM